MKAIKRIFVEKKPEFAVEAKSLYHDLRDNLGIEQLTGVRIINRYDISLSNASVYERAKDIIFSEPPVDLVYEEELPLTGNEKVFAVEYLPGQYDQRADSAVQCLQIIDQNDKSSLASAKVIVLDGEISDEQLTAVKKYYINPVEAREADLAKPTSLQQEKVSADDVEILWGFKEMSETALKEFHQEMGLAMSLNDLAFCQKYFKKKEKREPTITEIKVIDTYWSDHCRHTTFSTKIDEVVWEDDPYSLMIQSAFREYQKSRSKVYGNEPKDMCLMDLAVIAAKELKKDGKLSDLDESEEINACSIVAEIETEKGKEEWLVMFKNETHNHPTEIEPFGGAATCLGGAIRDPLSGRSYVYQAMRVTGAADPRATVAETLPGKLPQRKITTGAAAGYSSYGNQIGLATGLVAETYHPKFVAKRMEIGAVIAAAPKENVVRERPVPGDLVVLLGGKTGRDGCGGATGSSKEHTEESLLNCGAEVQKGNPPTERKIQRLFRNAQVSRMIKRCNDFGAGGVSVAIGELTDGLQIELDKVPKKYAGLDGTELAISESQERMAVVIAKENLPEFLRLAKAENLEATVTAEVTEKARLKMIWRNKPIVDLSREFLDTNGVKQETKIKVVPPKSEENYFKQAVPKIDDLKQAWFANLQDLNVCSQKGLIERFDSTIGAGTVLMPLGGKEQLTPTEGMVAKLPLLNGETDDATAMAYGYNPYLADWSPFHGALYAVIESVAKTVLLGCDYSRVRLSLQEYFEKLGQDIERWGKPFSALLGAFTVQKELGIPAIGGKDSMSGTFKELNVPPTLVSFAVGMTKGALALPAEFQAAKNQVVLLPLMRNEVELPDFKALKANLVKVQQLIKEGKILSGSTVKAGGLAGAVSKMAFGNKIGFKFTKEMSNEDLFMPNLGSLVLELSADLNIKKELAGLNYRLLGQTINKNLIKVNKLTLDLNELLEAWMSPLERIFPTKAESEPEKVLPLFTERNTKKPASLIARPKVFIPVFPGTNCEYDSAAAFRRAGAEPDIFVFRNLTGNDIADSVLEMEKRIKEAQIIMFPGGFSAGDEPEGSGKFIAAVFRNPRLMEAVHELLYQRDGLILGICNGFQALIKLGLLPEGKIGRLTADSPTLTYNQIGRHISCLVKTKVVSVLSPWFSETEAGEEHTIAISHGEGRFIASQEAAEKLLANGQIATQYIEGNPNGSVWGIEGITSPDGRVLGKMGHSERLQNGIYRNVPGNKDQKLFVSGVKYFA